MNRAWRFICCGWMLVLGACNSPEYSGPQRFPLSGQVTYDGQPIDAGSISFLPQSGSEQRVSGGTIQDGAYSVPQAQGANAGKYRIEIRWQKLTGKKARDPQSGEVVEQRSEGLPSEYHKDSKLTVEVTPDRKSYDFHLKSN